MPDVNPNLIAAAGEAIGSPVVDAPVVTAPFSTRPVCRLVLANGQTAILKTGAPIPASVPAALLKPGATYATAAAGGFRWADLVLREDWMYRHTAEAAHLRPTRLGVVEADGWLGLILEDLTAAQVPPPWTDHAIDAVVRALADLHTLPVRRDLPPDWHDRDHPQPYFARIAQRGRRPGDLPADLATPDWWAWWDSVAPDLARRYESLFTAPMPRALVHNNVRSDNLFLRDGAAIFIDWDHAIIGTPAYDSVYWAMGVEREQGVPASQVHDRYLAVAPHPGDDAVRGVLAFWTGYFLDHLQAAQSRPVNQQLRIAYLRLTLRWQIAAGWLPPLPH